MPFLDWVNKNQAAQASQEVPYHLLRQVSAHGDVDGAHADNLLIQGDNLLALKALLPFYRGQVKCIFIDPPYNTQSAFEHYDDRLEHSQWLSMMYPRLVLLRELLAENGSIWVTLDDNEAHYCKVMMDEVFGRQNFISNVVWQKRVSPANDAKYFSTDHDSLLVFSRQKKSWKPIRLQRNEAQNALYKNPDNDARGPWNSVTYTGNKNKNERPNLFYLITNPNTGEVFFPPASLTWRYSQERHKENIANKLLYWGKDGKSKAPRLKMFLSDAQPVVPRSVWNSTDAGSTQVASTEQKILNDKPFGTPKPELLLARLISIATNPSDLVLDSFLGSGTTAAVAHKMGRRYIGIEMGEHAQTHCLPRLEKVIQGEQGGISQQVGWQGGGGFRFCKLGSAAFDANGAIHPDVKFNALAAFLWHFETGTPGKARYDKPRLGVHNGTAYYLLYNGILGDRRPEAGNVLTQAVLQTIEDHLPHPGPKVIYGEATRLSHAKLSRLGVTFKQTPYDIPQR